MIKKDKVRILTWGEKENFLKVMSNNLKNDIFFKWFIGKNNSVKDYFEAILDLEKDTGISFIYGDFEALLAAIYSVSLNISLWKKLYLLIRLLKIFGLKNFLSRTLLISNLVKEMPKEKFIYLFLIAKNPELTHKKIGTVLLDKLINVADKNRMAIYAEFTSKNSLEFGIRNGFKLKAEKTILPGITLYLALRLPFPS